MIDRLVGREILFFVLPFIGWLFLAPSAGRFDPEGLLQLLFLVLLYIFDTTKEKKRFLLTSAVAFLFGIVSKSSVEFNYTAFYTVCSGITFWIMGAYFISGVSRWMTVFLGLGFSILSFTIFFRLFSREIEVLSFLSLWMFLTFLPMMLEREQVGRKDRKWFAVSLQQATLRAFFVIWAIQHRHEILSMKIFESSSMVLVSLAAFTLFFGLLNWKTTRWEFIYESFLTLFVGFCSLTSEPNIALMGLLLTAIHFLSSFDHIGGRSESFLSRTFAALRTGGFGGASFWICLIMLSHLAAKVGPFELSVLLVTVFGFAWMTWVRPRTQALDETPIAFDLKMRTGFQVLFSIAFFFAFAGGAV